MTRTIAIALIAEDPRTQTRKVDEAVVGEYAERMLAGDPFPPIACRYDGKKYWLWDGYHRLAALRRIGQKFTQVKVEEGSLSDAEWDSCSVNASHGIPRSNAEKQEAVIKALKHPKSENLSSRSIARQCLVSRRMVDHWRAKLEGSPLPEELEEATEQRSGGHLSHLDENSSTIPRVEFLEPAEKMPTLIEESPPIEHPSVVLGQDGKHYPKQKAKVIELPTPAVRARRLVEELLELLSDDLELRELLEMVAARLRGEEEAKHGLSAV